MGLFANITKRKEFQKNVEQIYETYSLINKQLAKIRNICWYYDDVNLRKKLYEINLQEVPSSCETALNLLNRLTTYTNNLFTTYTAEPKIYKQFKSNLKYMDAMLPEINKTINNMINHAQNIDLYESNQDLKKIVQQLKILKVKVSASLKNKNDFIPTNNNITETPHQI